MGVTLSRPYDETLAAVREELAEQGFGVLTEIDVQATLKNKLGVDVPAQVILGACRPELAHRALESVPSIAALLPCNVVVRDLGSGTTLVEAVDPDMMVRVTGNDTLQEVATEARRRLDAALAALVPSTEEVG
jgi:uncharacterized protein (DUF302 family)